MTWTPLFKRFEDVKPTRRLYEKAADLIEKNGLAIRAYTSANSWHTTDETCGFCLIGALMFAALGNSRHVFDIEKVVARPLGGADVAIRFSDSYTRAEVVAKLRSVALTLEDV